MWINPVESWLVRNGLGDPNRVGQTDPNDPPAWSAPWLKPLDPNKRTVTFSPAFEADKPEREPVKAIPGAKATTRTRAERARDLPPSSASKEALNRLAQRERQETARQQAQRDRTARAQQAATAARQRAQEAARRQTEAATRARAAAQQRAEAAERRMNTIAAQQKSSLANKYAKQIAAQAAASRAAQQKAVARLTPGFEKMPATARYSTEKGTPVYTPSGLDKQMYPQGLTSTTQIPRGYTEKPVYADWTKRDGWDSSNYNRWQGPIAERKVVYGSPMYSGTMSENWGIGRSVKEIQFAQRFMVQYGFMSPDKGVAWGKWIDRNSRDGMYNLMSYANAAGMTIDEYMKAIQSAAPPPDVVNGPGGAGPSGYTGPLKVTQRDTSVSLTNLTNAQSALRAVMRDELGRDPTDAEVKKYLGRLNAAERKNPTITDVTTTRNKSGSYETSSRVVKEGGVNQEEFAIGDVTKGATKQEREAFSAAKYFQVIADLNGGA